MGALAEPVAGRPEASAVLQAAQAAGRDPQQQWRKRRVAPQAGVIGQAEVERRHHGSDAGKEGSGTFERQARLGRARGNDRRVGPAEQGGADDRRDQAQPQRCPEHGPRERAHRCQAPAQRPNQLVCRSLSHRGCNYWSSVLSTVPTRARRALTARCTLTFRAPTDWPDSLAACASDSPRILIASSARRCRSGSAASSGSIASTARSAPESLFVAATAKASGTSSWLTSWRAKGQLGPNGSYPRSRR